MKRHKRFIPLLVLLWLALSVPVQHLFAFDSLDEVISLALSRNLDVAAAALKLKNSAASLASEPAWRSSSVSLSANTGGSFGSVSGGPASSTGANGTSYGASLSVPLADWFSLGATGTLKNDGTIASTISATLSPLSGQSSKAVIDNLSSLQSYRSTLRSAVLQFRSTVRSLVVSKTEVAYKKAALDAAQAKYDQFQVLMNRGEASQTDVLDAMANLTQARLDYETAAANQESIHQSLAMSLGILAGDLPDFEKLLKAEGDVPSLESAALLEKSTYLAISDTYVKAKLDAESSKIDAQTAQPKPDITIKGDFSPSSNTWSAQAMVKLPLDLVFREKAALAQETATLKQKQADLTRETVALEYDQKVRELNRLYESWQKTATSHSSAQLVYDQMEVLAALGQKSRLDRFSAQADLLRSAWQLASAEKSYRDALESLSPRYVFTDEK